MGGSFDEGLNGEIICGVELWLVGRWVLLRVKGFVIVECNRGI